MNKKQKTDTERRLVDRSEDHTLRRSGVVKCSASRAAERVSACTRKAKGSRVDFFTTENRTAGAKRENKVEFCTK